jgi:hypothetical protein
MQIEHTSKIEDGHDGHNHDHDLHAHEPSEAAETTLQVIDKYYRIQRVVEAVAE